MSDYIGDGNIVLELESVSSGNASPISPTSAPTSTPIGAPQYNARFYVNPMGMTMGASDTLDVFDGYHSTTNVFKVQLQEPTAGTYNIRAGAVTIWQCASRVSPKWRRTTLPD